MLRSDFYVMMTWQTFSPMSMKIVEVVTNTLITTIWIILFDVGASLLQWIRRIKRFSWLACPVCLVSYPGNESCVHCPLTETGGHGVFPFSVCPAGENKYSLTRVKYTRPSISEKCVWFTAAMSHAAVRHGTWRIWTLCTLSRSWPLAGRLTVLVAAVSRAWPLHRSLLSL